MSKDKILSIGSGKNPIKGAVNLDILPLEGIEVVRDITKGLPFNSGEFNLVIADYVLEQIQNTKDFMFVMNEIHRILKSNGILELKVPNAEFPVAHKDPFDTRTFTRETFDYFNIHHYRYSYYGYGFEPWIIDKIEEIGGYQEPEKKDRLYVEMRKP